MDRARGVPRLSTEPPYLPAANPTFGNPPWEAAAARVLIVRLSPYEVAERSSTHFLLFAAVRRALPDAYVDLLFVRGDRDPVSVHALRSPGEFGLVLVSNSYILELLNVPLLLRASGIPLEAAERRESDPLVILGGANAMAAHALVEPTAKPEAGRGWRSFVDAIYFGEGEGQVGKIALVWQEHRGHGRRAALDALAREVRALWVPAAAPAPAGAAVRKAVAAATTLDDIPTDYPLLDGEEAGTARLQITYGCPALCSFCFESYDRRPYREVPLETLLQAARELKRNTGADRLELFSFNFSYHSAFPALVRELGRLYAGVSFMSQRIDVLARNPELLPFEIAAGKRSYTLGIEGVSGRIRAFLQKGVVAEDLDVVLAALVRERVRELKLFYIVTGYEQAPDVAELDAFLARLAEERGSSGAPRVIVSATYLLRMPFTPLRHDPPLLNRARAAAVTASIGRAVTGRGFEFRVSGQWEEHVTCQLLASAGYRARGLLDAMAEVGAWYEGGYPAEVWPAVERWMDRNAPLVASISRGLEPGGPFPLDFVDGAPAPDRLLERYRAAAQALTGAAGEKPLRFAPAHRVLDAAAVAAAARERALLPRRAPLAGARFPREVAGASAAWRAAWLLRETLRLHPGLAEDLVRIEEVLPGPAFPPEVRWFGAAVVRLVTWDPPALGKLIAAGLTPFAAAVPAALEPGAYREQIGRAHV
jgi:radical SAM superfamily enzyme YgiQ (UPF0313 family)